MSTTHEQKKQKPTTPKPLSARQLRAATLLFVKTGSHLYGLDHANSDNDYWRVVKNDQFWRVIRRHPTGDRKHLEFQIFRGNDDIMVMSERTFQHKVFDGVPLALEALFAQEPIIDRMDIFRRSFRAMPHSESVRQYRSMIRESAQGGLKGRVRALRLSQNFDNLLHTSRFNPTLSADEARNFRAIAASDAQTYIDTLMSMNYYDPEIDEAAIRAQFEAEGL